MRTRQQVFSRIIVYLVLIGLMLGLVAFLALPSTQARPGHKGSPGGLITQMRAKEGLSESQLGKLDPASEGAKLATFGLRGVAVNVLWLKAQNFKKKKDWANAMATINQLMLLEPHFVAVWRFLGWDISYNYSVEFDDYRERFRWVIRGAEFLREGIRYNEKEPLIYRDVGWTYAYKIGNADEKKEFRRLFTDPEDPYNVHHGEPPRDNWLVGKDWFAKSEKIVDEGAFLRAGPLVFYKNRPMAQMNYAKVIEEEGTFGEKARWAWKTAYSDWVEDYGQREFTAGREQETIRLDDKERILREIADLTAQIDALEPGLRESMIEERKAQLTPAEKLALSIPPAQRTDAQAEAAYEAERKIEVTHEQVARRIKDPKKREQALELAEKAQDLERIAELIELERSIVAYNSWKLKAAVEQTDDAIAAREQLYLARQAYIGNEPYRAKEHFFKAAEHWKAVLDNFTGADLLHDSSWADEMAEFTNRGVKILEAIDEVFPPDYPLAPILREKIVWMPLYRDAREAMLQAEAAYAKKDFARAKTYYEEGFDRWYEVLDAVPALQLLADPVTVDELNGYIRHYDDILARNGEFFPRSFKLESFVHTQVIHSPHMRAAKLAKVQANGILIQSDSEEALAEARNQLEKALAESRALLDEFPSLLRLSDRLTAGEIAETIQHYQMLLARMGQPMPEDFPLKDFVETTLPRLQQELSEGVSSDTDSP